MEFLGELAARRNLPVHSHMGEGDFDIEIVAKRFPNDRVYANVYNRYGLFGQTPTVMAHCLTGTDEEIDLMAKNKVMVAHCPNAALNNPSGYLFPIRKYLDAKVPVGLASDIGGGHAISMMQNIVASIQMSKQFEAKSLTAAEAFYIATKGGGALFGKVGSFEKGYEFDALIIDDSNLNRHVRYSLYERLQRFLYCGVSSNIVGRYCSGNEVII